MLENARLYHGTSLKRWESIRKNGFSLGEDFSSWLCAKGIYLVCNRPVIARHFAHVRAQKDDSPPVVLSVSVRSLGPAEVLDLTTDSGMMKFFREYLHQKSILETDPRGFFAKNASSSDGIGVFVKSIEDKQRKTLRPINWDCLVITWLVQEKKLAAVIAAVQEGNPFSFHFTSQILKYRRVKSYKGIRFRDHLQVCITRPDVIIKSKTRIRRINPDSYPAEFFYQCVSHGHDVM